jgi:crotonobetainyl-CoA:carnitine CoA-transferase CaiB-like acyl-CoA transferase
MRRPLEDVRVIAVEQFGAGPWATLQLADLGAEVIKVEDPAVGGDVSRGVPPFQSGSDSLFFETFNRNKKSVALDLRHPEGRVALRDLVREAHALFCNLRGDLPAALGLTYDALSDVNPAIVCCSLSGFGRTGPRAREGGYDYVMQGLAGWMSLTGEPDGPPQKSGLSLVDLSAGYVAALAIVAGLWRARRDGLGCDCDVSLFETALAELSYVGTWAATKGHRVERMASSAHPSIVPFQNLRTRDGWIVVACPKQRLWERLCTALGQPELAADERFATMAARDANRVELVAILESLLARRDTAGWLDALREAGVPCAPINDVEQALADPQAVAREALVEIEHPVLGTVREIASPLRLSGAEPPLRRGPRFGEHTAEVLTEVCGYSPDRVRALAAAGVLGAAEQDAA